MSRKRVYSLQFTVYSLVFLAVSSVCYAQPVSSTELIGNAKAYNNRKVEYRGEVVGDVMARGDFAWVNIHDGKAAIGVFGDRDLINNMIKYKGGYNYSGDILLIKGVFHSSCLQHGGDLDIHADEIIKTREGFATPRPVSLLKVIHAIGLAIIALGLAILCVFRAKR